MATCCTLQPIFYKILASLCHFTPLTHFTPPPFPLATTSLFSDLCMLCYELLSQLRLLTSLRKSGVHNAPSSPALLSSCRLTPVASLMPSPHLPFGLPAFLLPSSFPASLLFLKIPALSWCAQSRTASVSLLSPAVFQP